MKKIHFYGFTLAMWLLSSTGATCQNTFSKIYPIDTEDGHSGMSVNLVQDGYIISANYQSDVWSALYRTDLNGNVIWKKKYFLEFSCSDPELTVVKNDKIYIAGIKFKDSTTTRNVTVFVCLDLNGTILWSKTYFKESFEHEQGMKLVATDTGFLICSRRFNIDPSVSELVAYKMDTLGNILNEKVIVQKTNRRYRWGSARYKNGQYFLSSRIARSTPNSLEDAGLYELDGQLNIIDSTIIPSRGFAELGINTYLPLSNNKRLFYWYKDTTMRVPPYRSMNQNMVFYFLDSNNVEQNRITFFDYCDRYFYNLKELKNGDILGVGVKEASCFFSPPQITKSMVVRFTSMGQVKWQRYIVDSLYDPEVRDNRFFDFEEDNTGNLIVSGGVINKTGGFDVWLVKLDSNGCLHPHCPNEEIRVDAKDLMADRKIVVYPNPAYQKVQFDIPTHLNIRKIIFYDINGVVSKTLMTVSEFLETDLVEFHAGLYVLKFLDADNNVKHLTKLFVNK